MFSYAQIARTIDVADGAVQLATFVRLCHHVSSLAATTRARARPTRRTTRLIAQVALVESASITAVFGQLVRRLGAANALLGAARPLSLSLCRFACFQD